jgi:Tol biopolymer transport system component
MRSLASLRRASIVACTLPFLLNGSIAGQAPALELTIVDVTGARTVLGRLPASVFAPRVSPDGATVAFETRDSQGADGARLWVARLSDVARRRPLATAAGLQNWAPVWTPDGRRLAFLVSGDRPDAIYWRSADGTGDAEHLVQGRSAEGWTGGGSHMRFLTLTGDRDYGISLLDMRTRTAAPLIDLPGSAQHSSSVSPDGRWMAYASNETGRYEVWLEPLPRTGVRHQLTRGGGSHPLWTPDGRGLYFDREQRLFRLTVDPGRPSAGGDVASLPIAGFVQGEYRRQYDLLPDGRRFVMLFRGP